MSEVAEVHCIWCGCRHGRMTDDHIIPRWLGGTRALSLLSCEECQNAISKAESEVARKSPLGLWRASTGPGPRKKNRSGSGRIEPRYLLREDPNLGGYAEATIRAPQQRRDLVSLEINLETLKARKRATTNEEFTLLIDRFAALFNNKPDAEGAIGEIRVTVFTEHDQNVSQDPEFWPRVFLDVEGHPHIRARSPAEAERFASVLLHLVRQGAFNETGNLQTFTVSARAPMQVSLQWNDWDLLRVVAKIGVGVALLSGGTSAFYPETLAVLRRFIIAGDHPSTGLPVQQHTQSGEVTVDGWPDHQIVVVFQKEGKLTGGVVLYGSFFTVDLGSIGSTAASWPAAVAARYDGLFWPPLYRQQIRRVKVDSSRRDGSDPLLFPSPGVRSGRSRGSGVHRRSRPEQAPREPRVG